MSKQLTLNDFWKIAGEIKALTKEIIIDRWKIAEKLTYIHTNWDTYKQQKDFPYKFFKEFIKGYYGWTTREAQNYLDAQEYKRLMIEHKSSIGNEGKKNRKKEVTGYIFSKDLDKIDKEVEEEFSNVGISTAARLNTLSKIDKGKSIETFENNPKVDRRFVETIIKELKADALGDFYWERPITLYGNEIYFLSEINHKKIRKDAYHIIKEGEQYPTLKRRSWFYHEDGREFSLREYARVQDFPDSFKFVGTKEKIKDQIGNAVSPKMAEYIAKEIPKSYAIELFAGCGGMAFGFEKVGHKVLFMNEREQVACFTYRANFYHVQISRKDIKQLSVKEILDKINKKKIDLVFGGPPCQGFSLSGNRFKDDPKNSLYKEFLRIVKGLNSKYFVMENVMGIKPYKEQIIKDFEGVGYEVEFKEVKGEEIGMKQKRHRCFFIGRKK